MNILSNVTIKPLVTSMYMKPVSMHFTLNGIERNWHILQVHDIVSIIIFNISRKVLVLVRQFRPAVYYNNIPPASRTEEIDVSKYPVELGVTIEFCAGIVDKNLPIVEIAREEILEECGYKVDGESLEKVCSCRTGGGVTGSKQSMFYCEVTDDMKVSKGGGVDEECIEVVEMTLSEIEDYICQENILSPPSFINVQFKPLNNSTYIKPLSMHFTMNGVQRRWDLMQIHDSVSIVIFNISRNVLIFVKQFRPAVYFNSIPAHLRYDQVDVSKYPAELGVTLELCAGIVDKNLPLSQIASEEILEECGYKVDSETLEQVSTCRSGDGITGSKQTLFYCEVTDDMKVSKGGGVDEEFIEVVEMSIAELESYISQDDILSPLGFMFAINWFLRNKLKK
ncbi:hypothetical protein FQR65_LT03372 [Abscondita terminalis]|nr:hypothetical protein FQR65_LT03372 [Abscondita terminalis]